VHFRYANMHRDGEELNFTGTEREPELRLIKLLTIDQYLMQINPSEQIEL
jgi:hypothetical protein